MLLAYDVSINDEHITVAGAQDASVLVVYVNATGKLGTKSTGTKYQMDDYSICLSVSGLTSRGKRKRNEHLNWTEKLSLGFGDEITVTVVDTDDVDDPVSKSPARSRKEDAERERSYYLWAKETYFSLKEKYEGVTATESDEQPDSESDLP